ncbi:MAG: transketolase, partial [Variovorax sp.]
TNAVGMALAEKLLAAEFNRDGHEIVDHHTYAFLGDGCMMEGISHEAAGLAGAWRLGKLIALYDDNGISIDGQVKPWFVDNTKERFEAHGWNVIGTIDGNDAKDVSKAIAKAKKNSDDKPTLIICKTVIGKGSPNRAGTAKAHGEALGAEEIKLTRESLHWTAPAFEIPAEVYQDWDAKERGAKTEADWNEKFAAYAAAFPELASEFTRRMKGELPKNFHQVAFDTVVAAHEKHETVASRKASQLALESFTAALPEMLGGSADLTGSNLTNTKSTPALRFDAKTGAVVLGEPPQAAAQAAEDEAKPGSTADAAPKPHGVIGRHINYGVREFGMAAVMNGVAVHGGY